MLDTSKVIGRRELTFRTLDEVSADVDRIAAGPVRTLGNWSFAVILEHLARTMDSALDGGVPNAPWPIRFIATNFFKKRSCYGRMRAGFKLPKPAADVLIPANANCEAALDHFRRALARLKSQPERQPHAAFGKLTRDEWDNMQMRHAELHLSFVVPVTA